MATTPTLTPTKITLNTDPTRLGKAVKLNVPVVAHDTTGNVVKADLAELDDASAQAFLSTIKDWKMKLRYRHLLNQSRLGHKST